MLAHAGAGATWQAMLVLLSVGAIVVLGLAVAGVVTVDEPGDLVLPLAGSAVLASLSGATSSLLSDWVGWAFPLGLAALAALVLATTTSWTLSPRSPLVIGAVVVGLVAAVTLHTRIEDSWHPTGTGVGAAWTDAELTLVSPTDGDAVAIGEVDVVVAVTGGSIGPGGGADAAQAGGGDPEEFGMVRVFVDGRLATGPDDDPVAPREDCARGCAEATYPVELERGQHVLSLEFLSADGQSFDTPPGPRPTVQIATVEAG